MTARVRSPPHPTEDCWTGMTAQMEHSKCNDVCVILGVIEVTCRCVCHVQRLMHQSSLKWGRLFLSAVGILVFFFSLPAVSTSPCKKWITEVCDCNWPRLNLHLPLVFFFFPNSTLILDISADRGAVGNIFLSVLPSWLRGMSVSAACFKAFALQEIHR